MNNRSNLPPAPREEWIDDVIKKFGGVSQVAVLLEVSEPAVARWKKIIPPRCAVRLLIHATQKDIDLILEDVFPYYFEEPEQLVDLETINR